MNDTSKRREFKLVESDEVFWDELRDLSERLGWELGQTLKACFVFGWDLLSQRMIIEKKESANDNE